MRVEVLLLSEQGLISDSRIQHYVNAPFSARRSATSVPISSSRLNWKQKEWIEMVHSKCLSHSFARKLNGPFCNPKDEKQPPFPSGSLFKIWLLHFFMAAERKKA